MTRIYIYRVSQNLFLCRFGFSASVDIAMFRVGARKRKIDGKEQASLSECLLTSGVSDQKATEIWNKARKALGAAPVTKAGLQRVQRERSEPAAACYVPKTVLANPEQWSHLLVPDIRALLVFVAQASGAWRRCFHEVVEKYNGLLHPVIYHDEVVAGNVLAPVKVKKVTAFYLSFKEFWPCYHREGAWLPVMCVQHVQCDAIEAGLSAVIRCLVKAIHTTENCAGFSIPLDGVNRTFRIAEASWFIADHDAQRGTWCTKGSAGLKPCQFCANVCSKTALPRDGHTFHTIASWRWEHFVKIQDAEWRRAYLHLASLPTKSEKNKWEKAYGLNFEPHGLLADASAFQALPMTHACNDVMHGYYSNGIASQEIAAVLQVVKPFGLTLAALEEVTVQSQWRSCHSKRPQPWLMKRLFSSKQVGEYVYKGSAKETLLVVFLLGYYLHRFLSGCGEISKEVQSFLALQRCASVLRALKFSHVPLMRPEQVNQLHEAQLHHQQRFVEAYGEDSVIPKHHHRLHIPESCLKLGTLPSVETHESKHRILKSGGVLDAQRAHLNRPKCLQRSVLTRLLLDTVRVAEEFGLGHWDLVAPKYAAARNVLSAGNDTCQADVMQLRNVIIHAGQPAFQGQRAWLVEACLSGDSQGPRLVCRALHFESNKPWGSVRKDFGSPSCVLHPGPNDGWFSPVFWRLDTASNEYICLW